VRIVIVGGFEQSNQHSVYPTSAQSNFISKLGSELTKRSHEVFVFTLGGYGLQGRGLVSEIGESGKPKRINFLRFANELRGGKVDIVSLQGIFPVNALWLMTAYKKVVFSPRAAICEEFKLGVKPPWWALLNERISMRSRTIIAVSNVQRDALTTKYRTPSSRVYRIPNGVNDLFLSQSEHIGKLRSETSILFVGAMNPVKGVDLLLESINLLRQRAKARLPHVTLVGATQPWISYGLSANWFASLRQRYRRLFDEGTVVHLGSQSQRIIRELYWGASVLVLPSRFDAFGNVALEAMACGTPVIVSDKVGVSDLIRDGREGFVIPAGDTKSLVDRLSYLLKHDNERRRMGNYAKATAATYTWGKTASSYERLFNAILRD